jgi:hypothetical protein
VRLAVVTSLMLPPATLLAPSAFQRLVAAGKCKKYYFSFSFGFSHAVKNVRL